VAENLSELVSRTPGQAAAQIAPQPAHQRRESSISLALPAAREKFAAASSLTTEAVVPATSAAIKPPQPSEGDIRPITEAAAVVVVAAAQSGDVGEGVEQPTLSQAPAQQVFHRLLTELHGSTQGTSAPAPAARSDLGWTPVAQPLKSIEISLEPANLGKVTVKLSVRNDVIRIELDVAERQAAGLIEKDKDLLTSLMKSAGYQVDTLAVRHVEGDRNGGVLQQQQAFDPSSLGRDATASSLMADGNANGRSGQGQRSFDQQPGGQSGQTSRGVERSSDPSVGSNQRVASGLYI
jgi:flagellar hook-length control protein FliK